MNNWDKDMKVLTDEHIALLDEFNGALGNINRTDGYEAQRVREIAEKLIRNKCDQHLMYR